MAMLKCRSILTLTAVGAVIAAGSDSAFLGKNGVEVHANVFDCHSCDKCVVGNNPNNQVLTSNDCATLCDGSSDMVAMQRAALVRMRLLRTHISADCIARASTGTDACSDDTYAAADSCTDDDDDDDDPGTDCCAESDDDTGADPRFGDNDTTGQSHADACAGVWVQRLCHLCGRGGQLRGPG
eukprot:CAMPEP_0203967034 /NCGR_PEP_ID=MMETSP0359-20131031/96120_1 /ASSEMBLY_ACC=CAM_ASM_000338 /TAXON_ID=268821 /ORGANISM="Scrippsiella Hangoei, Strain SHTV-5" /LENGTH=182 /DNA_ID=CAMNT_0050904713 /DNA_START=50 /DNA_END=594 /DNA_ORIENTATION=-